ncbi:hypothetical protein HDV00_005869 [Rhizophlyctis rosea]|nr:hypothetical protein HDV00_005869 [Rhizophlyctis rosea]
MGPPNDDNQPDGTVTPVTKSSSQLLHILTYIPSNTPEIDSETRTEILEHINRDLSRILRLDFGQFWSTVLWPNESRFSVSAFLDAYLSVQSPLLFVGNLEGDGERRPVECDLVEAALAHKVFQVVIRIATAPEDPDLAGALWSVEQWATAIYDRQIVTVPWLMDVARIYARANARVIRQVFVTVLEIQRKYLANLEETADVMIDAVHCIQKKYEKSSGKGKGKGKGKEKGSSESVDFMQGGSAGGSVESLEDTDGDDPEVRTCTDVDYLTDALASIEALIVAAGKIVADLFIQHTGFVAAVVGAYEVANIVVAMAAEEHVDDLPVGGLPTGTYAAMVLGDGDIWVGSRYANNLAEKARRLKLACLALMHATINAQFFEPLGVTDETDPSTSAPPTYDSAIASPDETHQRAEQFCDFVFKLIELSPTEGPVSFLGTAPLLVDLEVDLGIAERVRVLREKSLISDDDARLDYVVMSLEHMLMFSGNAETRRVLVNKRLERQQALATQSVVVSHANANGDVVQAPPQPAYQSAAATEEYIKRTSLISQVQDLFPELGEGFIEACLIAFQDDSETVIMKILESDLPEHVNRLDRTMARTALAPQQPPPTSMALIRVPDTQQEPVQDEPADQMVPESETTLLSTRRNVFDGDEFDVFSRGRLESDKVVFGKKNENVDDVFNDRTFVSEHKEALLETQYDDYDDEYDDTYDSTDIRLAGTVELHMLDEAENMVDGKVRGAGTPNESPETKSADPFASFEAELVALYESNRGIFDASKRKTGERAKLRERTGMSDEQLEGWFKMFERDPRKTRLLQKYEWRGNRAPNENASHPTGGMAGAGERRQQQQAVGGATERGGHRGGGRGGGGGNFRGGDRGRGRGGGGGQHDSPQGSPARSVGTPEGGSSDETGSSTGQENAGRGGRGGGRGGRGRGGSGGGEEDRARKDRNKARVGNHNRREGHARKLARGMGGPM